MALRADDCYADDDYVTDNGRTTVDQGALTPEQKKWLGENHNKPIDAITCLPLTPAQKLYLALCKNGFNLPKALASCGLNADEAAEAQQPLKIRDADGVVTEITRPTFVGAALNGYDLQGADLYGADLRHADLREANLQGADLWEADLEFANLQGADLYGADLRHADLREANLQDAKMQGADLSGAKMQGTDLQGADLSLTDLSGADFDGAKNFNKCEIAFYDAENPPKNLPDNIPDNITDNLLALDKKSYEKAKELQDAYREALVSDNEEDITAAEKALTDYLKEKAREAAKKAIQQAAPVLGKAATLSIVFKVSAVPAVTVTGDSPTTAASPSDVSLGGGNGDSGINPYEYYGISR
jgi:hypothetical protein